MTNDSGLFTSCTNWRPSVRAPCGERRRPAPLALGRLPLLVGEAFGLGEPLELAVAVFQRAVERAEGGGAGRVALVEVDDVLEGRDQDVEQLLSTCRQLEPLVENFTVGRRPQARLPTAAASGARRTHPTISSGRRFLVMNPSAPASSPRSTLTGSASLVQTTMGIRHRTGSDFRRRQRSNPLSPGRCRSLRTRSNRPARSRPKPRSASGAVSTSKPASSSTSVICCACVGLSSITSTLDIARPPWGT